MFAQNRVHSRKEPEPPSPRAPFRVICSGRRTPVRSVVILIGCIVMASFFMPALSQSADATPPSYLLDPYGPSVSYRNDRAFMLYHDRMPTGNTDQFTLAIDEEFATQKESERTGGISFLLDDGTTPIRMFEVNPSLPLPSESMDSHRHTPLETMFYVDNDLKGDRDGTGIPEHWSGVGRQLLAVKSKNHMETPVDQFQVSLPQEQKAYNLWHENVSDALAAYPEPILQQPYSISVIDPSGGGQRRYGVYRDAEPQYGGNIKLPLSVPWARGKTNRTGILPDAVYIGTDFDYFSIAESLQSWKSGSKTLPSDLNRLGMEWLDTPSGYIHFEWRLGK